MSHYISCQICCRLSHFAGIPSLAWKEKFYDRKSIGVPCILKKKKKKRYLYVKGLHSGK